MRLDGKVAIVTGASRGIGRSISRGLAAHGASVVVAARTEVETSQGSPHPKYASGTIVNTAKAIEDAGGTALPVRCDVRQAADLEHLVQAALERFGRLDVVVANAGVDCESPVVDLDLDLLDRCLGSTCVAPCSCANTLWPHSSPKGPAAQSSALPPGPPRAIGKVGWATP